jgi:hypothetical protein
VQPRKPTNDAGAICEAVTRPSMRFVPVKTEEQQAVLMLHRTRDFLVRQLTQVTNAIRAHLAEFGIVAPKGVHNVERLLTMVEDAALPEGALGSINLLAEQFRDTQTKIEDVTAEIGKVAENDEVARRLQTLVAGSGIGPITSSALAATLPDVSGFKAARDLAAWIGVRSVTRTDRVPARTAEAAFERRQGAAGEDIEDGQPVHPTAALSRRDGDDHGATAQAGRRRLALADHAAKASEARRHRPGQSHGADHLGVAQNRGELSGYARLRKEHGPHRSDEIGEAQRGMMAN